MDYNKDSSEPWEWQGDGDNSPKDSNFGKLQGIWDVSQNQEDISYMFDETTPVKACGDLAYHATAEKMDNELDEYGATSSQVKRRRMLQFNSQVVDHPLCCEALPSAFLNSKEIESTTRLPEASQWISGFPDASPASAYEGLDQSSERWLTGYLNNADMDFNADDLNLSGASDAQLDITEYCNIPSDDEVEIVQESSARTPQSSGFKGKISYMKTPSKVASSVAYPFAFIKPCGFQGDVTLKDINQRICTPPPTKSKESDEDPSVSFPTSAFSGKPVVGKTKIRTEGGKGSITIMRTKG